MARQRKEGAHELGSAHYQNSANPTSTRELAAVAGARAHRSCDDGSAFGASKWASPPPKGVFSCGEADEGGSA